VKRKRAPVVPTDASAAPVVPETLLNQAKRAIETDHIVRPSHCTVCGDETTSSIGEGLCWVCRRLKVSAWRDSDSQMPAQE